KWSEDSWNALGSGMDSGVTALAVSGSDLYVGGNFTGTSGAATNRIAKWDGSSWNALGSGMSGSSFVPYVSALAVSGSDVYAGGLVNNGGSKKCKFNDKMQGGQLDKL